MTFFVTLVTFIQQYPTAINSGFCSVQSYEKNQGFCQQLEVGNAGRDPSTWRASSPLLEQHWGLVQSGAPGTLPFALDGRDQN